VPAGVLSYGRLATEQGVVYELDLGLTEGLIDHERTEANYLEAFEPLTGRSFPDI
jgi:hypothetical protein